MAIWHETPSLQFMEERNQNSLVAHLGIELVEVGDDYLTAKMPVDQLTKQPAGVLHGGASVALAETVGTWAAVHTVDRAKFHCVGMEINANHVRPVTDGWVVATARPLHLGRSTQVWDIDIRNEEGKRTCISRLTVAIVDVPSQY